MEKTTKIDAIEKEKERIQHMDAVEFAHWLWGTYHPLQNMK